MGQYSLSIVLPVHRSDGLDSLVAECLAVAARYADDYELILTAARNSPAGATVSRLAATHWRVSALPFTRPPRFRAALRQGWSVARGDYILTCDQERLASGAEVARLLAIAPDYDAVFGYRIHPSHDPFTWLRVAALRARVKPSPRDPLLHTFVIRSGLRDLLEPDGPDAPAPAEVYAGALQQNLAIAEVPVAGAAPARPRRALEAGALLLLAGGLWMWRRRGIGGARRYARP
ncbi:MAG: glycosyltransferase [Oscillochloridaceae bacterium]|nr:glycosyltransferase [Chloroflexaceae bacterium]MDW8390536.1 glycosyltransferase [Oscillochloridaceae bacterium]